MSVAYQNKTIYLYMYPWLEQTSFKIRVNWVWFQTSGQVEVCPMHPFWGHAVVTADVWNMSGEHRISRISVCAHTHWVALLASKIGFFVPSEFCIYCSSYQLDLSPYFFLLPYFSPSCQIKCHLLRETSPDKLHPANSQ